MKLLTSLRIHKLNKQTNFILILLWTDYSGVIRFTVLRRPAARRRTASFGLAMEPDQVERFQ
jgi:hypothetical protein